MGEAANVTSSTWPPEDEQLLQMLQAGNEAAWIQLQAEIRHWLILHLRRRLNWATEGQRQAWAEECTQEACARILGKLHLFRGEGSLLGWCRVVAVNVANDWMRRDRQARLVASAPLDEKRLPATDPMAEVDQAALRQEIQGIIDAFVATLSEREQQILRADRSQTAAIAQRFGITPNNLHQIRHRALGKIRRHLEDQGWPRTRLQKCGLL